MTDAAPSRPRKMRLAVFAQSSRVSGGQSVGKNLIAAMGRAAPEAEFLFAVHAEGGLEGLCRSIAGDRVVVCRRAGLAGRWLWETFVLTRRLLDFAPDVVLDLGSRGLIHPPCPQAILCQRAHFFYPPSCWGRDTLKHRLIHRLHAGHFGRALRRTSLLLCQTTVAERRLRERYGYRGPAALCPNALSADVLASRPPPEAPESLRALAGKFLLLCVAKCFPNKNLDAIVEVFHRYPDELREVAAAVTVSPRDHPKAGEFLGRIRRSGLAGRIINVGPLAQEELAGYYTNCHALLLPTLLESFSGTYLEAMHFGTPILTSDLDFARVVCGDAAVYFDPHDLASIKDAILRLKGDAELRCRLIALGRRRLETMHRSWDEVAADVVKALEGIARRR